MLRFQPLTDQEIAESKLLPDGTYPFECIDACSHTSKEGNMSIKITLNVKGPTRYYLIDTYLSDKFIKNLKHFCDVGNLKEQYSTGTLTVRDCKNVKGFVMIKIGKSSEKIVNGQVVGKYDPKNEVVDFVDSIKIKEEPTIFNTEVLYQYADKDLNDDVVF